MKPEDWSAIYKWKLDDPPRLAMLEALQRARFKYGGDAAVRCFLFGEGGRPIPTYEVGLMVSHVDQEPKDQFVVQASGPSWALVV